MFVYDVRIMPERPAGIGLHEPPQAHCDLPGKKNSSPDQQQGLRAGEAPVDRPGSGDMSVCQRQNFRDGGAFAAFDSSLSQGQVPFKMTCSVMICFV
jgi:hypothetical protein